MPDQKLLYMIHNPPRRETRVSEALDALLTAAVFDQASSVLFRDDGVWCLVGTEGPAEAVPDEVGTRLTSLADYGVDAIFACKASLEKRGLQPEDLTLSAKPLDFAEQRALIAESSTVLTD